MVRYVVVIKSGCKLSEFESDVESKLNDGFSIAGPLCVTSDWDGNITNYSQPLVKYSA